LNWGLAGPFQGEKAFIALLSTYFNRKIPLIYSIKCFHQLMERLTDLIAVCQEILQHNFRLRDFLNEPRTMADIIDEWIVYQRPREPREFYTLTEGMIMQKHLDLLISNSMVVKEGVQYRRT